MKANVGTFCPSCWAGYYHPEQHTSCPDTWQRGSDLVVCMCGCARRPREEVVEDGEKRRRRAQARPEPSR